VQCGVSNDEYEWQIWLEAGEKLKTVKISFVFFGKNKRKTLRTRKNNTGT
jgi:hypothetical protein